MATGFAFGTLLLNTAAAIVVYFVYSFILPGLFELGSALMDWFKRPPRRGSTSPTPRTPSSRPTSSGKEWAQLVVVRPDLAGAPAGHRRLAGAARRGEVTP